MHGEREYVNYERDWDFRGSKEVLEAMMTA